MAIDLLHSFIPKGQSVASKQTGEGVSQTGQTPQNLQIMRAIKALQAGQTIQGEIISVKGDSVQLSLMNQMVLEARLEQSISLTPGTLMAFQIKSNNSSGLSLMPLFTNTAVDPNGMKALDMAGIPLNDRTLKMVQTLMERGLPIDKQSLQDVYRDVVAFKGEDPASIISLKQMNMPVTADNLEQFKLYENNQHFLSNTFSEIGKEISSQLTGWIKEGNLEAARTFLQNLWQIFGQSKEQLGQMQDTLQAQTGQPVPEGQAEGAKAAVPLQTTGNVQPGQVPIVIDESILSGEKISSEKIPQSLEEQQPAYRGQLSEGDKADGKTAANTWEQLIRLAGETKTPSRLAGLFERLWEQQIKPQLMLEPQQVMDKEDVQEFYDKLTKQMQQLETMVGEQAKASSPLAKAIHNTTANLDFMNQMNQMHAYIQLPLKLSNQEAKGELYVFTNRRSMTREDGRVTALLHLDMEYLGKMDIFVALENQKVSTQFYLEKEEHMDFLEKHMDKLTSRLNKRGYECSIQTCLRKDENETTVMETIINEQSQSMLLSTQAFDMRA